MSRFSHAELSFCSGARITPLMGVCFPLILSNAKINLFAETFQLLVSPIARVPPEKFPEVHHPVRCRLLTLKARSVAYRKI